MRFLFQKPMRLVDETEALPGRDEQMPVPERHFVNGHALVGPYPQGLEKAVFGLGCFWGAHSQKRRRPQQLALALLLASTILLAACGGGGSASKHQVQVYTVTVTGMTGVLQHSTIISVTVQ